MGLDQYAFVRLAGAKKDRELAYWRKHPNLHGWMQRLYADQSGVNDPDGFNCVEVELTTEDVDALERSIRERRLPGTTGFFFGSGGDEHYREADLKFVDLARKEIDVGNVVYYTSWW